MTLGKPRAAAKPAAAPVPLTEAEKGSCATRYAARKNHANRQVRRTGARFGTEINVRYCRTG